jgi:hypothetical protein
MNAERTFLSKFWSKNDQYFCTSHNVMIQETLYIPGIAAALEGGVMLVVKKIHLEFYTKMNSTELAGGSVLFVFA